MGALAVPVRGAEWAGFGVAFAAGTLAVDTDIGTGGAAEAAPELGSVVAALFLSVIREALRPLQQLTNVDFRMVIYSLLLIVLMLTRPNGLFGTREYTAFLPSWLRRKILGPGGALAEAKEVGP